MKNNKITVCGIKYDDISLNKCIENALKKSESGSCTVFTPNSEISEFARENPKFLEIINSADISVPDGEGVILASRLAGNPILNGKIAGVELGLEIAKKAAEDGFSLFLLGGESNTAEIAANNLKNKFRKLKIAGHLDGFSSLPFAAKQIIKSKADIVFVCLGSPLQEEWIYKHRNDGAKIYIGLGGSIDIYAGKSRRAPKFMIKFKLEWLWRLFIQPSRIKRMLKIPKFLFAAAAQGLKNKV